MERRSFLQSCSLCKKALGAVDDIYMYRGDAPFCSEECRQEQIDADDAEELRTRRRRQQRKRSPSAKEKRTGAFAFTFGCEDDKILAANATVEAS